MRWESQLEEEISGLFENRVYASRFEVEPEVGEVVAVRAGIRFDPRKGLV